MSKRCHAKGDAMAEVVILGAGLTGLSTAFHLEQQAFYDYEIFDQEDRPGGLMRTTACDGFLFDYTGHYLHVSDPYFLQFLYALLPQDQFLSITRKSGIYSHNTFTDYPYQMNLYGLPANIICDCIEGFVQRKRHLRRPQNFYDWVLKYFGEGLGNHFFFPYNSKLLAYPPKKIHPSWTGRFVPQTSLRAMITGSIAPREQQVGYNSSFYYPKCGGIECVIKNLVAQLKNKIKCNRRAVYIDTRARTIHFDNGNVVRYEKLISTIPLSVLLSLMSHDARSALQSAQAKLHCASVYNFNLGFKTNTTPEKHWVYFPEHKFSFYRLGFWHNICSSLVPTGKSALYGELSFQVGTKRDLSIKRLVDTSIKQTLSFLGLTYNDICAQKDLFMPHAYVTYDAWREKNIHKILETLQTSSLYSIGRYGAWKYASMQEAVLDGKTIIEKIIKAQKQRYGNKGVERNGAYSRIL